MDVASSFVSSITECPICLQTLRNPRALPCLHTFCEECLSAFIERNLSDPDKKTNISFPCPVCRSPVIRDDSIGDWKEWVSQFPANDLVLTVLKNKGGAEMCVRPLCTPCKKRDAESEARLWCTSCQFHLCQTCRERFHDGLLPDHSVVLSDELQQTRTLTSGESICKKHNEQNGFVCIDHEAIICFNCVADAHRPCKNIQPLLDYVKELKGQLYPETVLTDLENGVCDMESLNGDFRKQQQTLTKDEQDSMQSLDDMDQVFQQIKSKAEKDIRNATKENTAEIQTKIDQLENLRKSMSKTAVIVKAVSPDGNEEHLVSSLFRGQSELRVCKKIICDLQSSFNSMNMLLDMRPSIQELQEIANSATSLVKSTVSERQFPDTKLCTPLFRRTAVMRSTFKIPTGVSKITDSVFLPNGDLLMVDNTNKSVLLCTQEGELHDKLVFSDNPNKCCNIPGSKVAVSTVGTCTAPVITILEVKGSKLAKVKDISIGMTPHGITFVNGYIIATCPDTSPGYIVSVTLDGYHKRIRETGDLGKPYNITACGERAIFAANVNSKKGNNGIHCVSLDALPVHTIKCDTVSEPRGLACDRDGNLYVCGKLTGNIVQISKNLTDSHEVLSGIGKVESIAFHGSRFFISKDGSSEGTIYKLK